MADVQQYREKIFIPHIFSLPENILLQIFSHLDIPDLRLVCLVCSQWRRIACDSCLWKNVDLQRWHHRLGEENILLLIHQCLTPLANRLGLANCTLTPEIFRELAEQCSKLRVLNLNSCNVICRTMNANHMGSYIHGNEDFPWILDSISFPKGLTTLDLRNFYGGCYLIWVIRENLTEVKHLGFGDLHHGVPYTQDVLAVFSFLPKVVILDCSNCEFITDHAIGLISVHCKALESLNVKRCRAITGSTLAKLIEKCTHLKTLILSGTKVNDVGMSSVCWKNSSLTEIDLSCCHSITTTGLMASLPHLKDLTYLTTNLCGNGKAISDDVVNALQGKHLQKLCVLSLRMCIRLTTSGVLQLLPLCESLQHFSIADCFSISITDLADGLQYLKQLKTLEVGSLFGITDDGAWENVLTSVARNCQQLVNLILIQCFVSEITGRQAVNVLIKDCAKLKNLGIFYSDRNTCNMVRECLILHGRSNDTKFSSGSEIDEAEFRRSFFPLPTLNLDSVLNI